MEDTTNSGKASKVIQCAHKDIGLERCTSGPHWGKQVCNDCGAFIKWQGRPFGWAPESFMPFGKHKGTPLHLLPDDYCEWLYSQDLKQKGLREYLQYRLGK